MNNIEYLDKKHLKVCYCNSEDIVACGFKNTRNCPRVCRLFGDEEFEKLKDLFTSHVNNQMDER